MSIAEDEGLIGIDIVGVGGRRDRVQRGLRLSELILQCGELRALGVDVSFLLLAFRAQLLDLGYTLSHIHRGQILAVQTATDQDADNNEDAGRDDCGAITREPSPPRRPRNRAAAGWRAVVHRIPLYCLDLVSGAIKSAPARNAPESPERIGRTPGISITVADDAVFSGCARITGPAFAVSSGATGVAAPEVPGGGLAGGEPGLAGAAPGAVEVFGGALLFGAGGGALPDGLDEEVPEGGAPEPDGAVVDEAPPAPDGEAAPDGLGSALRMIGRPSLPEPITTTFALGDCESKSVASMPRQRK